MAYLNILIQILAITTACSHAFVISTLNNLECTTSRVQCLSNTTYTICANVGEWTILSNLVLKCPEGYICSDKIRAPCILETDIPTTQYSTTTNKPLTLTTDSTKRETYSASTIDSYSVTDTSTAIVTAFTSATTKKIVRRPVTAPTCTTTGLWPASLCNQYYECVKSQFMWIVIYNAQLNSCQDNYYFDSELLSCVPAEESDCLQ